MKRLALLLPLTAVLAAADGALPLPAPAATGPWTFKGRLFAQYNAISTTNATDSRDTAIAGAQQTSAWLGGGELHAGWQGDGHSVDQDLAGRYGRSKGNGLPWTENVDELRYAGVYRTEWSPPHFTYGAWGADSVFTGAKPRQDPLDPVTGRVSVGYGERYKDFIADRNQFEVRLGVREQKRWERGAPLQDTKPAGGPEAFARYEHELTGERPVRMFAQYEVFSFFGDLAHTTNLVTAGLTVQLAKYLSADFAYRAFHETRPKWAGDDARGFGAWSSRQEATVGLSVLF